MRACRSSSPRCKPCTSNRKPNCYKPCCLPRRRCQSLSPKRSSRQFYEQPSCSPSSGRDFLSFCNRCRPYDLSCSSRSSKCRPCSPCQPRRCCIRDRDISRIKYCLPSRCESPLRCSYLPCETSYPCKRDYCSPSPCDPCFPRRNPCYPGKCDPCDPCIPLSCRPGCYRRQDPYISCDPCYPVKCDLSYAPSWRHKSCTTRKYCDPCYSPLSEVLKSRPETCHLRYGLPCGDSSGLSRLKLRDLTCDNFRKVCYPKEVPIKSCTAADCRCDFCNCSCASTNETACDVIKCDSIRGVRDEGPSENFYLKSRRLGNCLERFDPHLCPWEADVSISGTVRGHCTSTALEVARRMSGRFRADGDRYTTDSCENKSACLSGTQRMSLGRLDDGSALNFSRNNDPFIKINQDKNRDASKSNEPLQPQSNITAGNCRSNRTQRTEDKREDDNSGYPAAACRDNFEFTPGNTRAAGLVSGQCRSRDNIIKDKRSCSSKRPNHHSVSFGSDNDKSDYQSALEKNSQSNPINNQSASCNEVQNFLNSRKDCQQRNSHNSGPTRDISKETMQKSSTIHRAADHRYTNISPDCHSIRRRKADGDDDCPLFIPTTHFSHLGARNYPASKSVDDIVLHSLGKADCRTRNRHSECSEVSLECGRIPRSRRRGFIDVRGVDRILEDRRIKEHY